METPNPNPPLPPPLTVEELLAELTLLTNTEVIPPNQLLSLIAKSHVALTAQFVRFQNQQAQENLELRQAMMELGYTLNEKIEPTTMTRNLVRQNWIALLIWGILLPIAAMLSLIITHTSDLQNAWRTFTTHPASLFIVASILTIALLSPVIVLVINTTRQCSPTNT